jgi:hypothetical protein
MLQGAARIKKVIRRIYRRPTGYVPNGALPAESAEERKEAFLSADEYGFLQ